MRMLVHFGKQARLRFISHLDLQRFLHMAIGRTGLPVAYSQGFNPHPQIAFSSALALYWTSEYEVLDIKLAEPIQAAAGLEAMRRALPADLPVYAVRLVDDKRPSAMIQVQASDYRITLNTDGAHAEEARKILEAVETFQNARQVTAVRKTKSGEREIDIRPLMLDTRVEGESLVARLMLTEQNTLKPDLYLDSLCAMAGVESGEARIHRMSLLGYDNAGQLRPIMKI